MSNKSHRLQKSAARMFLYGSSDWDIMEQFKIRFSTLQRWKRTPHFIAEVERLQQELRTQLPMRMLRLFDDFLDASERSLRNDANMKNLSTMLGMIQVIEKERFMMNTPPSNRAEMVPNEAQTVPNSAKTAPNEAGIVPNSSECFRVRPL
jgi:hypothetical protein